MQWLWFSLPSLSKSSPAARPRLALTSSSPRQGKAPRAWAGGAEAQTSRAGSRRRAATGPRISVPTAATVAAAASQLGRGRPSAPVPRSGEGFLLRSRAGYAGRMGIEEGALGRAQPGDREGGGGEEGRSRPLLRGGLSSKRGAADAGRSGCAWTPRFPQKLMARVGDGCRQDEGSAAFPTPGTTT